MVTRNRLGPQGLDGPSVVVYHNPPSNDPRIPAAPTNLRSSPPPQVYQIRGGGYAAACSLTWDPPVNDVDGNRLDPAAIQVWGRKGTAAFASLALVGGEDTTILMENFKPTETWQFKVRTQSPAGKFSAYSNVVSITMPKNDPPPLPPSKPTGTTRLGTVAVTWDGKASGGGAMPPDIKHVLVQRCVRATFTPATDVTEIDQLAWAGTAVDAPLTVGDSWFYRFIAVDNAGQDSQPSGVFGPIVVDGIKPVDIPLEIITPGMLSKAVADTITDAATKATTASTDAKNAAKIFSQPTKPTEGMKLGDLWFDTSASTATTGGNKQYRFAVTALKPLGDWISVRDLTLSTAFPNGTLLAENFLDKDAIRTKFLQAGLIDADKILVKGSVSADSGVIGELSASSITTGTMHGDRITAGTITASSMFLGDTENLVDEPRFQNPQPWPAAEANVGAIVAVTDAPNVAAAVGRAWQIVGNATQRTVPNSRRIAVRPGQMFYAEVYVRKVSATLSGTVQLVMLVKRKGELDTSQLLGEITYKATDPANVWTRVTTVFTTDPTPPAKPVTTHGKAVPALGYEIQVALRLQSNVTAGTVQFTEVMLRRQSSGSLIVDGAITASQIASNTITADNIGANQITTAELDADHIDVNSFKGGKIEANSAIIGHLDAAKVTVGVMHGDRIKANTLHADRLTGREITGSQIKANTLKAEHINGRQITGSQIVGYSITGDEIKGKSIRAGHISGRIISAGHIVSGSITANELHSDSVSTDELKSDAIYSVHIRTNEIKARNILGSNVTASKIHADAINGKTITGATIRTAASGRRVQMTPAGLTLYNSSNTPLISMSATSGSFYIRSAASGSRVHIDGSGIRLFRGSSGTPTVNLSAISGNAAFSGTITASNISAGSTFSGGFGSVSNGTWTGGTKSGGTLSGTINNTGTLSGGTIRSNATGTRVQMSYDMLQLIQGGTTVGTLRGHGGGSGVDLYPGNLGTNGRVYLGVRDSFVVANSDTVYSMGIYNRTSTGGNAVYIASNGFLTRHTSSQRYKQKIRDLELDPGFLDIRTATWVDKPNLASVGNRTRSKGTPRFTGFIAEDVQKCGLVDVVEYDQTNRPDGINVPALLAHTVRYVQTLVTQVGELTARIAVLEGAK